MFLPKILSRVGIDSFLVALITTVAIASLLPARGEGTVIANYAIFAAVALLFFLYGAKLSPRDVLNGLLHWRLQSVVFCSTFVLFPIVGLALTTVLRPWLPPNVALGLMFVCVLPSTVQSSIAFTSIARGNVPAALCSASASNLFGMVFTPLLVLLLLSSRGSGFSLKALEDIAEQLLLPFLAGQAVRPFIGAFLARHKRVTSLVDRGRFGRGLCGVQRRDGVRRVERTQLEEPGAGTRARHSDAGGGSSDDYFRQSFARIFERGRNHDRLLRLEEDVGEWHSDGEYSVSRAGDWPNRAAAHAVPPDPALRVRIPGTALCTPEAPGRSTPSSGVTAAFPNKKSAPVFKPGALFIFGLSKPYTNSLRIVHTPTSTTAASSLILWKKERRRLQLKFRDLYITL